MIPPIPDAGPYVLGNVRLMDQGGHAPFPGGSGVDEQRSDILVEQGRITAIMAPGETSEMVRVDMGGRIAWSAPCDIHTHLDKGFIWGRAPNPDGSFAGAVAAVGEDREARWTTGDVRRRMEFGLACAYAHGTRGLRTHLDTIGEHGRNVWPLFREIQSQWADRLSLQAVSLTMPQVYLSDEGASIVREVAMTPGGCLGGVLMHANASVEDMEAQIDAMIDMALEAGCDIDLHVDENGDAGGTALEVIARVALRRKFTAPSASGARGRILCGHCCSLSVQDAQRAPEIVAKVRDAGIGIVSLPMCNLYLQDRTPARTPRWRGVSLVHELRAAGVPVMFASDNTRDPFYPYGDLDMLEVFTQAVRVAHLDHPLEGWLAAVTDTPAQWMGLQRGLTIGGAADLVIFDARSANELLARPSTLRRVIRQGRAIEAVVPSYEELDNHGQIPA